MGDTPIPSIKQEIEPHGCAEDDTAHNADLHPLAADDAGVYWATEPNIVNPHDDEIEEYDDGNDNGIIAVADLPPANKGIQQLPPIVIDDEQPRFTDNDSDNDSNSNVDNDDDCINFDLANNVKHNKDTNKDEDDNDDTPGVCRSWCKTKGKTSNYTNYRLMMAAQCQAKDQQATIREGMMFFLWEWSQQCQANPHRRQAWMGFRSGTRTVFYQGGPKEIQDKRQISSDEGANANAWHECIHSHLQTFID